MKTKLQILLLFCFLLPLFVYPQQWKKDRVKNEQWNVWAINANAGITSFYGDLSSFDANYIEKLHYESGPATGIMVTKHFDRLFAISGQIIASRLKGSLDNISFKSEIFEYNLHLRLNIYNLFAPYNNSKFGINVFGGLGNFLFKTTQTIATEGKVEHITNQSRVPELVYFVGGGLFIQPTSSFAINTEISIRRCNNDMLDGLKKNNNDDYYSYLNVGITYYFGRFKQRPVRNKARIAHSDKRLKPLK